MAAKYFVGYGDDSFRLQYSGRTNLVYITSQRTRRQLLESFLDHLEAIPFPWEPKQKWDKVVIRDGIVVAILKTVGPTSTLKFKTTAFYFLRDTKRLIAAGFTLTETNRLIL